MVLIAVYLWAFWMSVFRVSTTKYLQTDLEMPGETLYSFVQPLKWDVFSLIRRKISGCEMCVPVFLSSYHWDLGFHTGRNVS